MNSMRLSATIIAALVTATGCGQSGPLDNQALKVLSNTRMHGASLTFPDGYEASLAPDDFDMMRNLISSLGPIRTANEGELREHDYRLVYIAGMDPAIIEVKMGDDREFTYQWGRHVYTGGNPNRFRDGVEAIRKRVEARRGEALPAEQSQAEYMIEP